ncbi:maleylpyruvate isomerase N-terminal domain-containing protein [Streptomyces bobili]|uniref:maleylpyruvate isomerase N-terminal domain-containing protein n=1 Tax=Streptomyces bobili TaxID=67280 RepID=UPI0033E19B2A
MTAETRLLVKALTEVAPETPVAACPGWNTVQLTAHLYQAVTWAAGLLRSESKGFALPHTFLPEIADNAYDPDAAWPHYVDTLARDFTDAGAVPADPHERATWLEHAVDGFVTALRQAGPRTAVWTPFGESHSSFWASWGALEIGVHRADVDLALGLAPRLNTGLCVDSVNFWMGATTTPAAAGFFNPRFANLRDDAQQRDGKKTLLFQAVDPSATVVEQWHVAITADGPVALGPEHEKADVTVTAPADLLLLLLKRRRAATAPGVGITGDASLLDHWLENTFG